MKVSINVMIGQIIIRYKAPMAEMEPATEFTTAVVLLFKLIMNVLRLYKAAYPTLLSLKNQILVLILFF